MNLRAALGVLVVLALPHLAVRADGPEMSKALEKVARERVEAARVTYEITWSNYKERRAQADTLYRWSVRWLEAEKTLADSPDALTAAYQAHFDRMRALERIVEGVQRARQATIDEVSSAEYYRAEADVWLLQAKEKAAAAKKEK
jgi:hypothetical protein